KEHNMFEFIMLEVIVIASISLVTALLLGVFARRILGTRISTLRILLAALFGLAAELGFESQFVWNTRGYSPALIPVQVGIVVFVAIAFLVLAELLLPQGALPRPDRWIPIMKQGIARAKRY